jgi:hypothetical protein
MSPTNNTSDISPLAGQATMAPVHGGTEPGTAHQSRPGSEIGNSAQPSLSSAKLKLKLRSPPTEPTTGNAPRRPVRNVKTTAKHGKEPTNNGASLPETKPGENKALQPKSADLPGVDTSRVPHESTKRGMKYTDGGLTNSAGGSITTKGRDNPSLHINPGNINDPIDVDALPSPPPHRLDSQSATYYTPFPLQYRPSRPNVAPILFTPNGAEILSGKISGHQSHDIYRSYIDLKDVPAPPGFAVSCAKLSAEVSAGRSHSGKPAPFPYVHPAYANEYGHRHGDMVSQPYATPLQRNYQSYPHDYRARTASYHTPVHGYPIFPVLNEEHLRQRAVQFVLDRARPRRRKRRLSDDPDETSGSEYGDADEQPKKKTKTSPLEERCTTPSQPSDEVVVSTPSTGISEDNIFDRNLKLSELVEHTQLLTAMLMTYPRSADQKGMREDIAMLATVTDKRLASWDSAEGEFDRDTRQRFTSAVTPSQNRSVPASDVFDKRGKDARPMLTEDEQTRKRSKEDEVRRYLSAGSKIWDNKMTQEKAAEERSSGECMNERAVETDEAVTSLQDAVVAPRVA